MQSLSLFTKLRSAYELLKTIDDPRRANIAFGINTFVEELLTSPDAGKEQAVEPELRALHQEAYDPEIDLDRLAKLPPGTLGHEFARFIRDNGIERLDTLLRPKEGRAGLFEYAVYRAYKVHDILHVVLGCDVSVMGEVRIVAFSYGQASAKGPAMSRASAVALAVLLLHLAYKEPASLATALTTAVMWFDQGFACGPHVVFRFEERWDMPVEDVRSQLLAFTP